MSTTPDGDRSTPPTHTGQTSPPDSPKKDRTHLLYIAVVAAVGLGILVGLVDKELGIALKPLGTGFVNLIKMMIGPIIF